jgi:hypothetical protein
LLNRLKRTAVALVVSVLSLGLFAVAVPATAQAEPVTYSMECTSQSGIHSYVTKPSQCSWGVIKFISSYDGKVKGKLDMYALQSGMKLHDDSLQKLYEKCSANIICQIGIAAIDTLILSKVKVAYVWFKAVLG